MEKLNVGINYGASAVTVIAGLTINEWVALGGLLIGLATLATNLWYKREALKLQKRERHDDTD
ncbi:phage holin family protein [Grimontia kaedaensis]|uniref:Phage holin family protein n=1 Tax=Grimontia kaedaensis TaxID=2872157 RepID=A0ABY4WNF5_9GAMM|nr:MULTISPECIES: phage holin [Grimontia]USH01097.1 phage holin family protein [Grimontia kaedaensis]